MISGKVLQLLVSSCVSTRVRHRPDRLVVTSSEHLIGRDLGRPPRRRRAHRAPRARRARPPFRGTPRAPRAPAALLGDVQVVRRFVRSAEEPRALPHRAKGCLPRAAARALGARAPLAARRTARASAVTVSRHCGASGRGNMHACVCVRACVCVCVCECVCVCVCVCVCEGEREREREREREIFQSRRGGKERGRGRRAGARLRTSTTSPGGKGERVRLVRGEGRGVSG